jgi:hypothetical protein
MPVDNFGLLIDLFNKLTIQLVLLGTLFGDSGLIVQTLDDLLL